PPGFWSSCQFLLMRPIYAATADCQHSDCIYPRAMPLFFAYFISGMPRTTRSRFAGCPGSSAAPSPRRWSAILLSALLVVVLLAPGGCATGSTRQEIPPRAAPPERHAVARRALDDRDYGTATASLVLLWLECTDTHRPDRAYWYVHLLPDI